jgi:xanthine dehydrogenase accessory factor
LSSEAEPLENALAWLGDGRRVALCTVVGTWGSSPRAAGSLLAVADDGRFEGSVSGGCVEGAVVAAALAVLKSGTPRLLDFGVSDAEAWEAGLACGGQLQVFVEPAADPSLLRRLLAERPIGLITDLAGGGHRLVTAESAGAAAADAPDLAAARRALAADESRRIDAGGNPAFVTVFNPPARLVIVGAVHVAQVLAPMAALAGFAVVIIDPRRTFASPQRFPELTLVDDWPDEAVARLRPDVRTAVVVLSHDPKLDDPALEAALRSNAFYIGALGSRKTQAARRQRLSARGFGESDLARIHGPVGLDLGGRQAAEIAVAILAQVIAARHGRTEGRTPLSAATD